MWIEQEGFQIEWIVPNAQKNQMEPIILTLAPRQKSGKCRRFREKNLAMY